MSGTDDAVLVVGAGPVGMSAALALAARDVPVSILEADPADRDRPGSRADYVHGATLDILEAVHPGLGRRIADAGLQCPTHRTLWRGREVFSHTYPAGDPAALPHSTRIPQVAVEAFLLDALGAQDIDVHWDSAVEAIDAGPDGVRVETADGDAREAPFVIGADGGSSTVRHEIDVEMAGTESANDFLIVDVDDVPTDPRPPELIFHYRHPDVDGRNVFVAPFAGGWRIDLTCRASDDPEALSSDSHVRDLVAATVGDRYADRVSWVSTYRFKQVTADRFVDGHRRVLLAGDAAHLFAPFGGRGMNSGIHDADAAASAIASALPAGAAVARTEVENYARLREAAAAWNTDAAGQALAHIHSDELLPNCKKRAAALAARWWEPAGRWLHDAPFGPHAGPPIPTKGKF